MGNLKYNASGEVVGAVELTGSKVTWILHVNAVTVAASGNTSTVIFRDVSEYDEVDVYVLCDQAFNIGGFGRKTDDSVSVSLGLPAGAQTATSGITGKLFRLEATNRPLRFDKINPTITNGGAVSATVTVLLRCFREVQK